MRDEPEEQTGSEGPEGCLDIPVSTGSSAASVRRVTGEFNAAWNSIAATLRSGRVQAIPQDVVNELLEHMRNIDRVIDYVLSKFDNILITLPV